ncbi:MULTISPECIES: FUSC family protein [unclassified Leclercia]|uniref:FUSC family protein n=2 Tax=Enterobacteriaceae TaxID=543 RepID=UPI0013049997|nr:MULTISPECIES: FUSC family protein [unclassified Leclercia]QVV60457.1 FUSC family protein [Leclercia sp. Colony189]
MNISFHSPTAQLKNWQSRLAAATLKELFAIQVISAVLVSVLLSDLAGFDYSGWAALSSYAVMNNSVKASMVRAFNRVTGTVLGGVLALLLTTYLVQDSAFLVLFCAVVGGVAVWQADISRWSYSWVLGAVTSMMVMAEAQKNSELRHLLRFTFNRIEEVVLGCVVCIAITLLFYPLNRRRQVAPPHQESHPEPAHRPLLPLQAGITLLLVTPILLVFQLTGFWQAMVSVLAVFILPASTQPLQQQIGQRMQQRLYGCMAATLLSFILLPLMHHYPPVYIAILVAGLWLGCHLQQGKSSISYFGRQFTVAWIIVFIQDTLWLAEPIQAVMRCASILIAIIFISIVMVVFRSLKLSV